MDVAFKVIENNSNIFADFLVLNLNNCIASSVQSNLKYSDITPVQKKIQETQNPTTVNSFANVTKVYENCIFYQIPNYFEKILSRYKFGLQKGYSKQQCLLVMMEKWF